MDKIPLVIVCGQTATGKTSLALKLAHKFSGEIISADSRQVYKDMNIGTGKDIPEGFVFVKSKLTFESNFVGFWEKDNVRIWGYDLVHPKEEFSVGDYVRIANKVIRDIVDRNKHPILEGGTGFYIKGVVDGISTADIPRNKQLRKRLEKESAQVLFEKLTRVDPLKSASMNVSDRSNKRRLMRALEVAQWKVDRGMFSIKESPGKKYKPLFIGLHAPKPFLVKMIRQRVGSRVKQGVIDEVDGLRSRGVTWDNQSMSALGYRVWEPYFLGTKTKEEAIEDWINGELDYAKRQLTWFKKDKRVNWFDITFKNWTMEVENKLAKWYSSL